MNLKVTPLQFNCYNCTNITFSQEITGWNLFLATYNEGLKRKVFSLPLQALVLKMIMNATQNKQNGRGFFSFLRRNRSWLEIVGYHVGDIQVNQPVAVRAGSTVVGNVLAPKISVAGMLYGSTFALNTIIEAEGQVWGDIYTGHLQVEPGAKIQGWINSLDESGYHSLQDGGSIPEAEPAPESSMPAESGFLARNENQDALLRRLQTEIAAALAARAELEHTFEKRLHEVAGEATAKAVSLREELNATRIELAEWQERVGELEKTLRARDTQIERQVNELTLARDLLTERNRQLEDVSKVYRQQSVEHEQLQSAKLELETNLLEAQRENETLADRVHSLETALQASLLHTSEQEESLVRWQELAEVTEKRVQELDKELQSVKYQLQESVRLTEMLQLQRRQLEAEWQKATDELDAFRHKDPVQPAEASASAPLQEQLQTLQKQLDTAEQEHQEQLLWYKLNLETSRHELALLRQKADAQDEQLARQRTDLEELKAAVAANQAEISDWMQKAEQSGATVYKREQQLLALQQQLKTIQQQAEAEKKRLQTEVRQSRLQVEAHEAELNRYLQEIEAQGKRLAEVRMNLIERDLQLEEARETAVKFSQTIKQIREVTTTRIQELEKQLKETRQRLRDVTAVLERRQRRQE